MPRSFTNPVITDDGGSDHGDPFVLRHRGAYFLYHTTDDGDRGISVHRSADLVQWTFAGIALEPGGWAQTDVWAPEVIERDGAFLMYVSGTTMGPDGEGVEADRRQGLARAADPLGPFAWDPAPLVPDTWSIDGHPFGGAGCSTTCGRTRPATTAAPGAATSSTACSRRTGRPAIPSR